MILGKLSMPEGSKGKKKKPLDSKKSMQEELDSELDLEGMADDSEQEEYPAEGDEEMLSPDELEGGKGEGEMESPLAKLSDDELLEEMRKRGLEA